MQPIQKTNEELAQMKLVNACANNDVELSKQILIFALEATNMQVFNWAVIEGHTEIVSFLLANTDVDPTTNYNDALKKACTKGYLDIVEILLKDLIDNPNDKTLNDYCTLRGILSGLLNAAKNNHTPIVILLLPLVMHHANDELELFSPYAPNTLISQIFGTACFSGCTGVVKLLMQEHAAYIDYTANNNEHLKFAIIRGHAEVVKLLLRNTEVKKTLNLLELKNYNELCTNVRAVGSHPSVVSLMTPYMELYNPANKGLLFAYATCKEHDADEKVFAEEVYSHDKSQKKNLMLNLCSMPTDMRTQEVFGKFFLS